MCQTCGCGDPEIVSVDVHDQILAGNERTARHNREHFREHGVFTINLMGSPGSGKTAILEATARATGSRRRLAAISGDLATDRDAQRLRAAGIPSISITTGSACHLDAEMIHRALHHSALGNPTLLFIENVGESRLPGGLRSRPGGERRHPRRHRGRGQAAEVSADVHEGRSRAVDQDRSPAASSRRQRQRRRRRSRPRHAAAGPIARVGTNRRRLRPLARVARRRRGPGTRAVPRERRQERQRRGRHDPFNRARLGGG